ncbi:MAG: TonB family protein [Alphaproteobacteria bacterium]|nr:TonB family protein [Alphaproteobacteria bacterium]
MSAHHSLLDVPREHLTPWIVVAVGLHVTGALTLWALAQLDLQPRRPLIAPEETIEVALVSLPKSALPQKASRRPVPQAPPRDQAPAVEPPPRQSDLAVPSKEPDPAPKTPPADPRKMQQYLDELDKMDELLEELDAPEGKVDRDAASPEGIEGAPALGTTGAMSSDPELAAYVARISRIFLENFRPIPAVKGKGYSARVLVQVDREGRVVDRRIQASSGNEFWDRAALSATEAVVSLPLPPERFRDGRADDFVIRFEDP